MIDLISETKQVLGDMPTRMIMSAAIENRDEMVALESKILSIEVGLDDCIEQVREIDR